MVVKEESLHSILAGEPGRGPPHPWVGIGGGQLKSRSGTKGSAQLRWRAGSGVPSAWLELREPWRPLTGIRWNPFLVSP